jgi:hypothetical protein
MDEFDLKKIYNNIASYKGLPFPVLPRNISSYEETGKKIAAILKGEKDVRDWYGRPFIAHATLGGVELGSSKEDHIMIQPLILFEGHKDIEKTKIEAGTYPGTMKEFISFGDYKLKIYGALINRNQKEYPYDQVRILKDIWQRNVALTFDCYISQELFDYVVIEKIKFKELTKSPGWQMYEIEAVSDGNLEVEYLKGDA